MTKVLHPRFGDGAKIDATLGLNRQWLSGLRLMKGYRQSKQYYFTKDWRVALFEKRFMQVSRSAHWICDSCSSQLLFLFRHGFSTSIRHAPRPRREAWRQILLRTVQTRSLANTEVQRQLGMRSDAPKADEMPQTMAQIEKIVHQARQTFGETLPINFLSDEEYKLYERLYGPPVDTTRPEDIELLQPEHEEGAENVHPEKNLLFRENQHGFLEEVDYLQDDSSPDRFKDNIQEAQMEEAEGEKLEFEGDPLKEQETEFKARMALFRDIAAANKAQSIELDGDERNATTNNDTEEASVNEGVAETEDSIDEYEMQDEPGIDDPEDDIDDFGSGDSIRTHPLTAAARSGTSPATLQIPKTTIVLPVAAILRDASNKHLTEVAQKTFGGVGLPNSTATPSTAGRHLQQAPIALEASQKYMGDMEGNAYIAAIMPGAYSVIMNTLVEVRKRIGSEWLRSLLKKEGGPRVLDAGAAGAGVQAWREILQAEWKSMHADGVSNTDPVPLGKATVVTGSNVLRQKASRLLENTTFLPRLPDYNPERDHPTLGTPNVVQPRKQYDIVLAPHTLWGLKEDYMRKNQVQNFWSLLNPAGGVLVIIEKGVPRGFELVAGARELLLNRHIASPDMSEMTENPQTGHDSQYGPKEKGMIIAPCTNHTQCPMYTTPGRSKGRKDLCHFSQRFIRPPYLQRILGVKGRNHEDIKFSYIAVQRGVDHRQTHGITQGSQATAAALTGYEESPEKSSDGLSPHMLSLPRAVLPPIKRRGHVILDLCTPAGRIERWTVPKSFSRQAYRDARKSNWGDLWALGAKTAIPRNIRLGTKVKKAKIRHVDELDSERDDGDDLGDFGADAEFEKRAKKGKSQKGKSQRPRKKSAEGDF